MREDEKCEWVDGLLVACQKAYITYCENGRHMHINWDFCPFCGANIEEPVKIEVGMFGKFWDDSTLEEEWVYGILTKIDGGYVVGGIERFNYFTPGLPKGFDQDGVAVKEEE